MKKNHYFRGRPGWQVFLLLPLLHFASVKLTFFCAFTPENEVVVWLPNAVLLAALLRFRGRRGWLMAALTFSSDVIGNLPIFSLPLALTFALLNVVEVIATYMLMRRAGASPDLRRIQDFRTFVFSGPLAGTLAAALMAGGLLKLTMPTATSYFLLTRLWWFGDALGMLIYTPLLLLFTRPDAEVVRFRQRDGLVLLAGLILCVMIYSARGGQIDGISVTPTLLLPFVLYVAFRFGPRWTTLAVAVIALATSMLMARGQKPFGNVPVHLETVYAQEFILTLCVVGMGCAILLDELKVRERELEARVRQRTHELEVSNRKLAALSATDGLTGIANRRRFDEMLEIEWRRAARLGQPIALAMLDVDYFKQYNDRYGHQAGDDCLRNIARLLADGMMRTGDLAARYGGEEFVFIAPATDLAGIRHLAEGIGRALDALMMPHETSPFLTVTASIGVAVLVPGENSANSADGVQDDGPETLVRLADAALYKAKQDGRNRVMAAGQA